MATGDRSQPAQDPYADKSESKNDRNDAEQLADGGLRPQVCSMGSSNRSLERQHGPELIIPAACLVRARTMLDQFRTRAGQSAANGCPPAASEAFPEKVPARCRRH